MGFNKLVLVAVFFLSGLALYAAETFESPIIEKEVQQSYGSGTLSVASNVFDILVKNKDVIMKIELPKAVFDQLNIGDVVRITYEKGLFFNDIKGIKLVRRAASPNDGVSP